jgi:endoribonuclease Dicer
MIRGFKGISDESQPLLEVAKTPNPLNRLSPLCQDLPSSRKKPPKCALEQILYVFLLTPDSTDLIPELCVKYCLSLSSYRTTMILPSIMARVNEMLLVKECNCSEFQNRLNEVLLLQALTTPAAGEGHDYQRLELLGESIILVMRPATESLSRRLFP